MEETNSDSLPHCTVNGKVSNFVDLPETHGVSPALIPLAPGPWTAILGTALRRKGEGGQCISDPETLGNLTRYCLPQAAGRRDMWVISHAAGSRCPPSAKGMRHLWRAAWQLKLQLVFETRGGRVGEWEELVISTPTPLWGLAKESNAPPASHR